MLRTLDLDPGPVAVHDTGGDGPPVVFVHGLLVDHTLWDPVVPALTAAGLRCIRPTLPLGSHTIPVRDRSRLTPLGVAAMLEELLAALDVRDVTIVASDTGGGLTQMLMARRPARVGRVVLTNCDAFDVFPPLAFRPLVWLARARLLGAVLRLQRIAAMRRSPLAYGMLTRRPVPDDVLAGWGLPAATDADIRGDATRFTAAVRRSELLAATESLRDCRVPFLLVWGSDDRFFTLKLGRRLAALLPDARLEALEDCTTFVSLDQPERLAELIGAFVPAPAARDGAARVASA